MKDYRAAYNALMQFYPLTPEDINGEQWRSVSGYEELYQISSYGRIKSFHISPSGKILKPLFTKEGYLRIDVFKNKVGKHCLIHRLVAGAFIPNDGRKPEINHIDGCKMNNYVGNLEWATKGENAQHAIAVGLIVRPNSENGYSAKLSNTQVYYIRENPNRLTLKQLASKFGVCEMTISEIRRGFRYPEAGGAIAPSHRISDNIRANIRAEYGRGNHKRGARALARKYGIDKTTVLKIIREG